MNKDTKDIYLEDPIKGKVKVGSLKTTPSGLLFRKNVMRAKHYMRLVEGYGLQKEIFDKFLRGKKGRIAIKEMDTGKFLIASVNTWEEHSKAGNYGDGKQIFLSERYMHGSQNFNRNDIVVDEQELKSSQSRLSGMYKQILAQKGTA